MSNVQLLVNTQTVEDKLRRMKELSNSIKELEAEYSMLKNDVINSYFNTYEEYRTPRGLLLASYKLSERNQFNSTKFKSDNGDLYAQYTEKNSSQHSYSSKVTMKIKYNKMRDTFQLMSKIGTQCVPIYESYLLNEVMAYKNKMLMGFNMVVFFTYRYYIYLDG